MKRDKIKKKFQLKMSRRQVLKAGIAGGAGLMLPWRFFPKKAFAYNGIPACQACYYEDLDCTNGQLSNPCDQPIFANPVPNALNPGFVFQSPNNKYKIAMQPRTQMTGLVDAAGTPLSTPVWGYGNNGPGGTWPGMTFIAKKDVPVEVKWENKLPNFHLLPVDTSLHWAYSLPGYTQYSIAKDGVPAVVHLHGGHSDFQYDGNPEFFFSPGYTIRGPQWVNGIEKKFIYHNDQPAGTLWYHDHGLGITRINVYAGLAGFYILRDDFDTGLPDNPLDLPTYPYEAALAIQDRMFWNTGELFYPAFQGDPYYNGFITDEDVEWPNGEPTALAEFFGDHMLVNGQIWPKMDVEPRNYRLRFLNGCDSRFLAAQFFLVGPTDTDFTNARGPIPFTVIGSDQGLASSPTTVSTLLMETGSRYDIIFDFSNAAFANKRIILKNIGGDEPFGGDIPGPQIFAKTDRIMAFDVNKPLNYFVDTPRADVSPIGANFSSFGPNVGDFTRRRNVALFEGKDEFGRLQPLLGTAEPATDYNNAPIYWPDDPVYASVGLLPNMQMEGSIAWHSPTTENPALDSTEQWAVWNVTGDAHPVHLHLVHFEIQGRLAIKWDTATGDGESDYGRVADPSGMPGSPMPTGDGTYLVVQPTVQHNSVAGDASTYGMGFRIMNPTTMGGRLDPGDAYVENTPKDMVTALPGQVTFIKATFDKPGRYVWHCHILSHEDHEMMRVLYVGPPGA